MKVTIEFDHKTLMDDIRSSIEQMDEFIGVDVMTADIETVTGLSRTIFVNINVGVLPDMGTFIQLCQQCDLDPGRYFKRVEWVGKVVVP